MDEKTMESIRKKAKKIYPNATDEQVDNFLRARIDFWEIILDLN